MGLEPIPQPRIHRAAQVLHNILWGIRRFAGLAERTDDLTMVGVRVLDPTG